VEQLQTRASEPAATGPGQTPVETDWLARFPSEVHPPEILLNEHVATALVEPSEADRQRLFSSPQPIRFTAARLLKAGGLVLVTLVLGVVGAIVALDFGLPSSSQSVSEAPVSAPGAPQAGVIAPPIQQVPSSTEPAPTTETRHAPPPRDVAVARESRAATPSNSKTASIAPRPSVAPVTSPPASTIPPPAPSLVRMPSSDSTTPLDTLLGRSTVTPPISSPPPPARGSAAAVTPSAAPAASTPPEVAARVARMASVQSVLDRYRDAFDSLDANAVEGFWPGADIRALNRAFAQIESQRLQFDHCDINLAGARAFASCSGYAEYTRKAGSRDVRLEPRQWTFTLGEGKNGWVILGVDARPAR
jgi:hypothetical protein